MKIRSLIQPEHSALKGINWFVLFTEGHQKAFSHIFKLQYPGLFVRTRNLLGNAEAAKKIVQLAFVNAWANREGFTTLDELKRFIRESVRENCTTYRLTLAKDQSQVAVGILEWILHHAITERKSLAQLAAKWHISENAAAIRKSRAFKTLLSLLADSGSSYPGSSLISH